MIIGLGIDLTELKRIKFAYDKFGNRFMRKILTPHEMIALSGNIIPWLAGRFAAKEACLKALGTGLANGITFLDIEVINNQLGLPQIHLHNNAEQFANLSGVTNIILSITHERIAACAVVIMEKE